MAHDLETVISIVKNYVDDVRKVMPVDKVMLYGSYAKGCARNDSDIDICFFLTSFNDMKKHDIVVKLFLFAHKYKLYIEPNVFEVSDLYDDNPFVKEVLRTGIEIK
jgi:predicted nucleotidyltransferase